VERVPAAERLSELPAELVETALGPVEVGRRGTGEPVLFVHGTPGGSDSSLVMGRFLAEAGFDVIAPSRPGYLGTPLAGRESIDDQADLHAALLDALGHERAGVVTWSGGGPSSYRLAVRHPERVSALVAFAAVSQAWEPGHEGVAERLMLKTSAGNWLLRAMAAHTPKSTVSATLKTEGDLTREELKALAEEAMADEAQRDVVLTMAEMVGDYEHRRAGIENDEANYAAIETLELERITVPTLIVVGSADGDVSPAHSEHAARTIPGAEQLVMDRGTHLCLFVHPDAAQAQARVVAHLKTESVPG
jgi:pimeloyl-ACP methyl ester carboxylesterase